ncbi:SsgA family sporulation/cell division regulator [Streptomyces sp. N35]|uniref:SsgA family sporulation/cell division regulator n=1 Tax=Streptomyces sp. N35 TaxID=2795730 RepID=UPI0018F46497|nr:SsgA family sporulation/cell division regulator [Streptomyces sp. N35]
MNDATTVCAKVQMYLLAGINECTPVTTTLWYDSTDPFAVRLLIEIEDSTYADWVFARDLLERGMHGSAGHGDVRVWPAPRDRSETRISLAGVGLESNYVQAIFTARSADLHDFLACTYDLVAAGAEEINFERELTHLLADG